MKILKEKLKEQIEPEIIFSNKWVSLKKTNKGFFFLERKGINSIAVFLFRYNRSIETGVEVLVRYQLLTIENNDDTLYPCPITGSLEEDEDLMNCVIREVKEESGYSLIPIKTASRVYYLGKYIVGMQTNESVFMYAVDVTNLVQDKPKNDGTYDKSISKNVWELIDNLKNYDYSACQIMYYKMKKFLYKRKII